MLILLAGSAICGASQTGFRNIRLQDTVSGQTRVTYLDLLKKVFPDVEMDEKQAKLARAKNKIPLRNLFGQELPEIYNSQMLGELEIGVTGKAETASGREKLLWLTIGVGDKGNETCFVCGNTLLAAYRVRQTDAELIDAASVKTGAMTTLAPTPKLKLAPQSEAVVVYNEENTNIGTISFSIVEVGAKGFRVLLKEFEGNIIFKCGYYIHELPRIRLLKNSVGGYRQIEVLVKTESGFYNTGDSETVEKRGQFRYVFNFQPRAQKYKAVINPERERRVFFKKNRPCMD